MPRAEVDSGSRYIALSQGDSPWIEVQLALIESVAPAPASILEVGAGTGGLALRLVDSGYSVTSLEPDRAAFEVLLERVHRTSSSKDRCTVLPLRFQDFTTEKGSAEVLLAMSVFSFLPHLEQRAFVQWAAEHVSPGGLFVFSAIHTNLDEEGSEWHTLASHDSGEAQLIIRAQTRPASEISQTVTYEYTLLFRGDVLTEEIVEQTLYPTQHADLLQLLAQNGFEIKAEFSSWSGVTYSTGDQFSVIVAELVTDE